MKPQDKDDFTICVHESSHALMSFLFHRGPESMEIFDKENDNGAHGICFSKTGLYEHEIDPGNPRDRLLLQKCILVGVAGPAGEFLYSGKVSGCEDDHEFALEQLRFVQPAATISDLSPYVNSSQRILAVPRNWGAVMDLAGALEKKRKLSGVEAKEILRNSRQPATPPFPPVNVKLRMNL
jgi:hypothetical protein